VAIVPSALAASGQQARPPAPSTQQTRSAASAATSRSTAAAAPAGRVFSAPPIPAELQKQLASKGAKRDPKSGNYLTANVLGKTLNEDLVAVRIGGNYVRDERGQPVFLRRSVFEALSIADEALFEKKHEHIIVGYGFRSNALQAELFQKLSGHGKVAPAGSSFHETGMAIDVVNTKDAHKYLIKAGFVGGCDGLEEDQVHYSIGEISKASDFKTFRRCTLPGFVSHIPIVNKKKKK